MFYWNRNTFVHFNFNNYFSNGFSWLSILNPPALQKLTGVYSCYLQTCYDTLLIWANWGRLRLKCSASVWRGSVWGISQHAHSNVELKAAIPESVWLKSLSQLRMSLFRKTSNLCYFGFVRRLLFDSKEAQQPQAHLWWMIFERMSCFHWLLAIGSLLWLCKTYIWWVHLQNQTYYIVINF